MFPKKTLKNPMIYFLNTKFQFSLCVSEGTPKLILNFLCNLSES